MESGKALEIINKKSIYSIMFFIILGCIIMAWVDAILSPSYAVKSFIKLLLFLVLPIVYSFMDKGVSFRNLFVFSKRGMIFPILLGIGVYLFIIASYFIMSPYFDFSKVTVELENNIGVNKGNFVFVALYISFINSLLEEFFFRGFAFLTLKKVTSRKFAYFFSATAFSVYHIAMMTSWFTPILFILLITSLLVAGLLFNWLNEKSDNIYTSWMVHMCANFAINTIGFMLFGIL